MSKPTLTTQVSTLTEQVAALTALLTAQATQGQHSTPTAVAEVVAAVPAQATRKAAAKPVVVVAPVVKSPSDVLKEHVEANGLAFARGGRTVLTTEALTAAVRVLKTGTPEILPVTASLEKRNVVGLAIGRDGKTVITQYVYKPDAE